MEKKTCCIGGVEVDADIARTVLNDVLPAVTRVTEDSVMRGLSAEIVRERAKITAETVINVMSSLLKTKA
ncbi:hypothetical protein BTJ39_21355 [Izhakiella australiensis]|uniref:Uncharacterized protein n=1 Tax=Izhakiella australiensis TaxID=1926881 RepID=A0A1S8YBV5_9GAMM|nr:hypothetical protein [Izhakiella australiensis]OON36520.1 hypothetical protein BTJ39_21355 [Izhakiella australiensis]